MVAVRYTVQTEVVLILDNTINEVDKLLKKGYLPSTLTDNDNIILVESRYDSSNETYLVNGDKITNASYQITDITND